ncbi:hypothetical protein TIFTF001_004282 [Ficus carica]|uniref:FLZ-type domain-containing protein n=1 Tax=Ficus carica TaxID=3494 RepID=A0AA87ZFK2_FICCA|nr:hypothetical protein TIFTF001_004282 [Ficus carica]
MTGITVDLSGGEASEPSDQLTPQNPSPPSHHHQTNNNNMGFFGYNNNFLQSMLSPRTNTLRRNSADFIETADFLRTCGLCKSRLASGRDIYIYMGDTAFCSLECRERHIKQAERKDNSMAVSSDNRRHKTPSSSVAAT